MIRGDRPEMPAFPCLDRLITALTRITSYWLAIAHWPSPIWFLFGGKSTLLKHTDYNHYNVRRKGWAGALLCYSEANDVSLPGRPPNRRIIRGSGLQRFDPDPDRGMLGPFQGCPPLHTTLHTFQGCPPALAYRPIICVGHHSSRSLSSRWCSLSPLAKMLHIGQSGKLWPKQPAVAKSVHKTAHIIFSSRVILC